MTIPDLPAMTVAHERPKTSDVKKAVEHNTMGAGIVGIKTQSCIEDPVTKEVRDCRIEWRMMWEVD